MRPRPSVLHVDLDAFYAAVEQRDKPSLRGRPVVVGGTGPRGVVATASYEARAYGVHSAMSTAEARARCPHAAFLGGRFAAYRAASAAVMAVLHDVTPLVQPLSLDEAYLDLEAAPGVEDPGPDVVSEVGQAIRAAVRRATGLNASVGAGTSLLVAKVASDLAKPDGLLVVPAGTERELLAPLPVRVLPGVGPATADRLLRVGVRLVGDLEKVTDPELVELLGQAAGSSLGRLARGVDERRVVPEREAKSVSVEDTFDRDVVDLAVIEAVVERMAGRVGERLRADALSGRTVTVKVRLPDFSTHSRSVTLPAPTDDTRVLGRLARRLVREVDTTVGVRLLGVGVSALADWVQEDLFAESESEAAVVEASGAAGAPEGGQGDGSPVPGHDERRWWPGMDVVHAELGPGWVWGSGRRRVTVRFETRQSGPGPVRTFTEDDPELAASPDPGPQAQPQHV